MGTEHSCGKVGVVGESALKVRCGRSAVYLGSFFQTVTLEDLPDFVRRWEAILQGVLKVRSLSNIFELKKLNRKQAYLLYN